MRALFLAVMGCGFAAASFSAAISAEPARPAATKAKAVPAKPLVRVVASSEVEVAADEAAPATDALANATHDHTGSIEVRGKKGAGLQTLASTPDGKVLCLVGPAKYAAIGTVGKSAPSEVVVLDRDGKELKRWDVPFVGQAIAAAPDGVVYVGGSGQIARYSAEGKPLTSVEVPHLAEVLKDQDAIREQAEQNIKQQRASTTSASQLIEVQIKRLEDLGDKITDVQKKQLEAYREYLKTNATRVAATPELKLDDVIKAITSRLRTVNAMAVTENNVYIACGELKGFGYAIWRMDRDCTSAERIAGPMSGCCGQMDIQAHGDHVYVAENSKKRVAQFDSSGKLVSSFGKSGRASDGLSFGGCCNPMNCRVAANGDIYTSESEGIVKRFSPQGEFLALVGYAKLTGGCKNVAVAASPKGDRVYFCDLPGSKVVILSAKDKAPAAE